MSFEAATPVRPQANILAPGQGDDMVLGQISLTPSESKRLIARAIVALPLVQRALEGGRVAITAGTTTAYVAEEILGQPVDKYNYAAGIVSHGSLSVTDAKRRVGPFLLHRGEPVNVELRAFLEQFEANDVFIKSANAVDPQGVVGVLMSSRLGGTMGLAYGILSARGCHYVAPVGLEKLVLSVPEAAKKTGILRFKYALGNRVGIFPVVGATVVTEIQALQVLTGVRAIHIGSGGISGSEGAVVLSVEGTDDAVARTIQIVESLKGEPAIQRD